MLPVIVSSSAAIGNGHGKGIPVSLQIVPSHVVLRRIAALKKELTVPGDSDVLHRSQLVRLNGRQAGLHRAHVMDAVPDLNHHLRPLFIGAVSYTHLGAKTQRCFVI